MMDPVRAEDCRLLLSLLKFAIVAPDQRERIEDWLRAKEVGLIGTAPPSPSRLDDYYSGRDGVARI